VLLQTLDLVIEGEVIFPASLALAALGSTELEPESNHADRAAPAERAAPLSSREIDILKRLVHGESNKQISRQLIIAETTVKVHVKAILRKVRLRNRTQAAIWGLENLPDQVSTASALQASHRVASEVPLVPRSVPPPAPNAKLHGRGCSATWAVSPCGYETKLLPSRLPRMVVLLRHNQMMPELTPERLKKRAERTTQG
jgi:two-component system nitrate/nitrite response regulator NarL